MLSDKQDAARQVMERCVERQGGNPADIRLVVARLDDPTGELNPLRVASYQWPAPCGRIALIGWEEIHTRASRDCTKGTIAMTEPRKGDWIQTFSGLQYWPLDPRPDEVRVEDIAHHLSMLCRFTGACTRFYSVAEHSVHVSHVVEIAGGDRQLVRAALLHDAAEAYCNDIARPVKRAIVGYEAIEGLNAVAIDTALDVVWRLGDTERVKQADNAMLCAEMEAIMTAGPALDKARGYFDGVPPEMLEVARYRMRMAQEHGVGGSAAPAYANRAFMGRYKELTA